LVPVLYVTDRGPYRFSIGASMYSH